jgi:hypothetical protein
MGDIARERRAVFDGERIEREVLGASVMACSSVERQRAGCWPERP